MTPPAPPPPKRPRGRPPAPRASVTLVDDGGDVAERLDVIIATGVAAMEARMTFLSAPSMSGEVSVEAVDQIIAITEKASEIAGRVRRNRDAAYLAARKIPKSVLREVLRAMSPDERAQMLDEFGEDGQKANVLS